MSAPLEDVKMNEVQDQNAVLQDHLMHSIPIAPEDEDGEQYVKPAPG